MVLQISYYPCGAILLRTKEICSKRMHRLVSVKVDYILAFFVNRGLPVLNLPCG